MRHLNGRELVFTLRSLVFCVFFPPFLLACCFIIHFTALFDLCGTTAAEVLPGGRRRSRSTSRTSSWSFYFPQRPKDPNPNPNPNEKHRKLRRISRAILYALRPHQGIKKDLKDQPDEGPSQDTAVGSGPIYKSFASDSLVCSTLHPTAVKSFV